MLSACLDSTALFPESLSLYRGSRPRIACDIVVFKGPEEKNWNTDEALIQVQSSHKDYFSGWSGPTGSVCHLPPSLYPRALENLRVQGRSKKAKHSSHSMLRITNVDTTRDQNIGSCCIRIAREARHPTFTQDILEMSLLVKKRAR